MLDEIGLQILAENPSREVVQVIGISVVSIPVSCRELQRLDVNILRT
jgi:hypothetical protein